MAEQDDSAGDNGTAQDPRAKRAIARLRTAFRQQCHKQLDAYLRERDDATGLPTIDVLIAYMGQGWGCSIGVSLREPPKDDAANGEAEPQSIEERAAASGIQIVSA